MVDIQSIALFRGLDSAELMDISAAARTLRASRGQYLFFEHERATTLYVIQSGWVRLFKTSADGRESVTRLVGPHEIAGISAVARGDVYQLTAQTAAPCQLLAFDQRELGALITRHPQIQENALRLLSGYLGELQQQYLELATERAEQRIAHALVRIVDRYGPALGDTDAPELPLTQRDLADLAGVTHYTMSRVLSVWRERGIASTARARLVIRDLAELRVQAQLAEPHHEP